MKKDNIFWISYSDLMSSLFFVMLVLFVVTIGFLNNNLEATKEQLEKVQELQTAVQGLPEEHFEYQSDYKRFKLNKRIQFDTGSSEIKQQYQSYLIDVGNSISNLINELNNKKEYEKFDIKYLVVIEGMASRDNYAHNYELSYKRSLALYKLWIDNNISFDPTICEIQISGSGISGIREYTGDEEYKNQQFLIHIIPKMGKIHDKIK